jgi:hypothetical protein
MTDIIFPPEYRHGDMVMWVPVAWLMQNIAGSCDYVWTCDPDEILHYIMTEKARDTGMGHLVEAIMTDGFKEEGAIGFYPNGEITDGHHRIAVAILLCLDEVPISAHGREMRHAQGAKVLSAHGNSADPYPIVV